MTNRMTELSTRDAARIAGIGYLIIFVAAIFAEFLVRTSLVVPGDAITTTRNIEASVSLFRLGICGYLVAAVFDIVVALALYVYLKPVNRSLALLAAWFRLAHATILGLALQFLLGVLRLLHGADRLSDFKTGLMESRVMYNLDAFSDAWLIGLVFFGLHCLLLGYLVYRSGYMPRVIGVLLGIAALGYLADSFAHFLLPHYAEYAGMFLLMVAVPAVIAELSLSLWLLWKGASVQVRA